MPYRRASTYSYPPKFNKLEEVSDYARRLYAELIENDSRGEETTARATDKDLKEMIVRPEWYGAKGDGVTDDTAAIQSAWSAAVKSKCPIYLSAKTYITDKITNWTNGMVVRGAGIRNTILKSRAGDTVIEISNASIFTHSIDLSDFTIQGNGGVGHGIYIHDNLYPLANSLFTRLHIKDTGGKGFFCPLWFSCALSYSTVDNAGDNAIEVDGGNTITFDHVYVGNIAAGKTGFRIYSGNPAFYACNGVDSGPSWGIFGRIVAEDGVLEYCLPIFIGCNIEDFESVGLTFKSGSSGTFIGTTIVAPNQVAPVTALLYHDPPSSGIWSKSVVMSKGAPWSDGYAIHTRGAGYGPFVQIGGTSVTQFYDEVSAIIYALASFSQDAISYANMGFILSSAKITNLRIGTVAGDVDITGNYKINGDRIGKSDIVGLDTGDTPVFSTVQLTDLTDGYVPISRSATELILNGGFDSDVANWTGNNCTLASVVGGNSGNCLELTRSGGAYQFADQFVGGLSVGTSYTFSAYAKSGTSGDELFEIGCTSAGGDNPCQTGTSSDTWVQKSLTFTALNATYRFMLYKLSNTPGTMLFDSVSIRKNVGMEDSPLSTDGTDIDNSGAYKKGGIQIVGAQAAAQANLKADYTTGDLDTEAEIIAAINATNAGFNTLLAKQRTHGLIATA